MDALGMVWGTDGAFFGLLLSGIEGRGGQWSSGGTA